MRFIWGLFFLISSSTLSYANPLCGTLQNIQDVAVKTLIETTVSQLISSGVKDQALTEKVKADQASILKSHPQVSKDQVGLFYFQTACLSVLKEAQQVTTDQVAVLQNLATGIDNQSQIQTLVATLQQTTQHQPTTTAFDGVSGAAKENAQEKSAVDATKDRGFDEKTAKLPQAANEQVNTQTSDQRSVQAVSEQNKKAGDCKNLGEIGTCSDIETIVKNLKEANLKYNHPETMYLGKRTEITLIIETTGEDQSKQLEDLSGDIKTGSTKVSRFMEASLSGKEFKIESLSPQRQTITTLAPVKWTWYVTPIEDGKLKRLNLELSAILRDGIQDLPPVAIKTFQTQINVDVKWWDRLIFRIAAFDPVYQLMAAIGALISLIVFVWRLGGWVKNRNG